MNLENIQYTIDLMERPETREGFSMAMFTNECGTPACLAGWLDHERKVNFSESIPLRQQIASFLGVDKSTASELCWLSSDRQYYGNNVHDITPQDVAVVLRRLRDEYLLESQFPDRDGTCDMVLKDGTAVDFKTT